MISADRYSAYRTMWVMVLYDLPTDTKVMRKEATKFRKALEQNGFQLFQFSIYIRHCASRESAQVHVQRVRKLLPHHGSVAVMTITDRQFEGIELYHNREYEDTPPGHHQLSLF